MMYPALFSGGPFDGIVAFLSEPFYELLQPRGEAAKKPLDATEAEFNMSFSGTPYSDDVTYERYLCSGERKMQTIELPSGETIGPVSVMVYKHAGVVGTSLGDDNA